MCRPGVRWTGGGAALAVAAALFTACSPKPASQSGAGGATGAGGSTTVGTGGSGAGGDTMGLKLGTGGPFAFPQNKVSGTCTLTTVGAASDAARAAYTSWKNTFLTSGGAPAGALRVQRPT